MLHNMRVLAVDDHFFIAWGYEFYLLVLKVSPKSELRSLVRDFQPEKITLIRIPGGHIISSIYVAAQNVTDELNKLKTKLICNSVIAHAC